MRKQSQSLPSVQSRLHIQVLLHLIYLSPVVSILFYLYHSQRKVGNKVEEV